MKNQGDTEERWRGCPRGGSQPQRAGPTRPGPPFLAGPWLWAALQPAGKGSSLACAASHAPGPASAPAPPAHSSQAPPVPSSGPAVRHLLFIPQKANVPVFTLDAQPLGRPLFVFSAWSVRTRTYLGKALLPKDG